MGVLISTCLSCPFDSFFTLTLQAPSSAIANAAAARLTPRAQRNLLLCIRSPSVRHLRWAFDSGATLRHIRNRYRQMSANRNLAKQRLDRTQFRDRRIRESTNVVL